MPHQVLLAYLVIHPQGQDSLTSTRSRDSVERCERDLTRVKPLLNYSRRHKCEKHECQVQTKGDAGDKTSSSSFGSLSLGGKFLAFLTTVQEKLRERRIKYQRRTKLTQLNDSCVSPAVGTQTRLLTGRSRFRALAWWRGCSFLQNVHTSSEAHPASYVIGNGVPSRG